MPKWMLGRALTLIGMLGVPMSGAMAQNYDSRAFSTESAARSYLRQNPTGPRANAAFLALAEFRLMRENPGLTRDQIIAGFGNRQSPVPVRQRSTGRDTPRSPSPSAPPSDPY